MAHIRTPAAEFILGDVFPVNTGYVRLVEYMGGDQRIAAIAREHYHILGSDEALIHRAVKENNRDILGMVELQYHFEMPINEAFTFVYTPAANVNEYSLRYSDAQDVFHNLTEFELYAQLSPSRADEAGPLSQEDAAFSQRAFERYQHARADDIAKELARAHLGSNLHTRFYWKINLADLLASATSVYDQEPSMHAVDYARMAISIAAQVAPVTLSAYEKERGIPFDQGIRPPQRESTRLEHLVTEAAEALLDRPIPVLGNGSVTLIDYMGGDYSILNAARVSTGKNEKPRSPLEDQGLINYLRRNNHTTPSEMVEFFWRLDVPVFVYRQGGRHRTFERVICDNDPDPGHITFYHPRPEDINIQSGTNHQGRGALAPDEVRRDFLVSLAETEREAVDHYKKLRAAGVHTRDAKRHFPVNRNISYFFKSDLHNASHYLGLRLHPHAQLEIRETARAMAEAVKAVAPWSWNAFETYRLGAMSLTAREIPVVQAILRGENLESAYPEAWLRRDGEGKLKGNTERDEFLNKLKQLRP